jgi:hypothetical protein
MEVTRNEARGFSFLLQSAYERNTQVTMEVCLFIATIEHVLPKLQRVSILQDHHRGGMYLIKRNIYKSHT